MTESLAESITETVPSPKLVTYTPFVTGSTAAKTGCEPTLTVAVTVFVATSIAVTVSLSVLAV